MEELVLMALAAVSALFELGSLTRLLHVSWKIEDLLTAAGLGVLTFEFILAKEADQQVALYLANVCFAAVGFLLLPPAKLANASVLWLERGFGKSVAFTSVSQSWKGLFAAYSDLCGFGISGGRLAAAE
ncbi:hypothetical protein [Lactobacillus delbrueckii]|uniref:hypothetical protein n=1 Tax=Lactobacillus delbrueckii TaxID=1584 RepID=UPI001E297EDA|nr:hypothetical protein [Lactobacillus delbrueckii]MCD5533886.1 hypothetical protein [Lactobacillus delbrueckii subsp. lactis]